MTGGGNNSRGPPAETGRAEPPPRRSLRGERAARCAEGEREAPPGPAPLLSGRPWPRRTAGSPGRKPRAGGGRHRHLEPAAACGSAPWRRGGTAGSRRRRGRVPACFIPRALTKPEFRVGIYIRYVTEHRNISKSYRHSSLTKAHAQSSTAGSTGHVLRSLPHIRPAVPTPPLALGLVIAKGAHKTDTIKFL